MKNGIRMILMIFLAGCMSEPKDEDQILYNFNQFAKESFVNNADTTDLSSLDPWEKCLLETAVKNHLDELNNWRLNVVDSFYIRNYYFSDLVTNFSFVSNGSGKFYFLYLPIFYDYCFGNEFYESSGNGNFVTLTNSKPIVVINSPAVDNFFDTEVFNSKDMKRQFEKTEHLLASAFPDLLHTRVPLKIFRDSLRTRSALYQDEVMKVVTPIISRSASISAEQNDVRIFTTYFGFIMIDFFVDHVNPEKLDFTLYFIPKPTRYSLIRDSESKKYPDCYR